MPITMDKYKYKIYDYSIIGMPKNRYFCNRSITNEEWKAVKKIIGDSDAAANFLFNGLKIKLCNEQRYLKDNPNWIIYCSMITPEKIYKYETSG